MKNKIKVEMTKIEGGVQFSVKETKGMPTHTRTPWKLSSVDIRNANNEVVALRPSATPDGKVNDRMFQDSVFITRAANAHDHMLIALKSIASAVLAHDPNPKWIAHVACQAIAKAEGK